MQPYKQHITRNLKAVHIRLKSLNILNIPNILNNIELVKPVFVTGGGGRNGGGGENGGDPGHGRPVTGPHRSKLFAKL